MSRGCHGNGCICEELEAYEKRHSIRKGKVIDGDVVEVNAFYCNKYVTKALDESCLNGNCVVNAFKLNPVYPACDKLRCKRKTQMSLR